MKLIANKRIPFIISAALFVVSLGLLLTMGLKPGIDFTGGTLIELSFSDTRPDLAQMQEVVDGLNYGNVLVQPVDADGYLLKMRFISEDEHQTVLSAVRDSFGGDEQRILEERIETVGPSISSELRSRSFTAGIGVMLAIIAYVAYAFRKVSRPVSSWKFGVTAIIALVHDVTITMGIFALLGHYRGVEIGIPFVVAMLTILGYSVNDTIVVFDRIREKLLKRGYNQFSETVEMGVNETIPRSINTSATTLLVLMALFLFGGESIKYFSLALIIGIALGTYSSIFLASPLLVVWQEFGKKK